MSKDFYAAIKERRSFYKISSEAKVSDKRISEVIEDAILHVPSAFNSQSARVILLLEKHHQKLWDLTKEALVKIVKPEKWAQTENKINSFAGGYGTVLYFDDETIVKGLQESFPLYADQFPAWAQQSNGMLQYMIWTSLQVEGFGASLQHYNPLIDQAVKEVWRISDSWRLIAQMPFGIPTAHPEEKSVLPIEERFSVYY
ncbi:MAG: nitroreductase family protein [Oscillospiraceae bacterium]|nr:nitroreductase family protein [Oscillospiraceae bacterium]